MADKISIKPPHSSAKLDSSSLVCLTPTRNEAWIIERFAAAATLWADHVIVADQGSTDRTQDILRATPSVTLVQNESPVFDEAHRQRLLLAHARKIPGRRILIGLDADEALSADSLHSKEWELINQAEPGTVLRCRWVNVLPGFKQAWIPHQRLTCGFVDDGSEHAGAMIHSPRVPHPVGAPVLDLEEIVVLHFQYVSWERMLSKQRWYQAWEYLKHQKKGPLDIFRQYNHMLGSWDPAELRPIREEWLQGYEEARINFRALVCEPITWWDCEVYQMLREHGPEHFRRIALWNKDWASFSREIGGSDVDLSDPRSGWEKIVHRLLAVTQRHRSNWGTRALERLLRKKGW